MDYYGLIGGIILLIIFIGLIVFELSRKSNKKSATNFLQGLVDKILEVIVETIRNSDPDTYDSFDEFAKDVTENIYNNVWDYVSKTAQEYEEVDNITKTVFKLITKDFVINFINEIFSSKNIPSMISNRFMVYNIEKSSDKIVEEDNELIEEYSDDDKYIDLVSVDELAPAEEVVHTEEELSLLNPPREEGEEEFDIEDDSMEIITDKKEIITVTDKNGNILYYEIDKNGKKKRVSKKYAEENMQ